jgi:Xaa-Pro aminopeptidase
MPEGGSRLEFSRSEYARRYARASALMEEAGIDALVVAQPSSIRYFTGLPTWVWVLPPVMPVIAVLPRRSERRLSSSALDSIRTSAPTIFGGSPAVSKVRRLTQRPSWAPSGC